MGRRVVMLVIGLLIAAAGACSDPTLTITVDFAGDTALRDATTRMRLTVEELTSTECDAIEYGQVSAEALDLGERTSVAFRPDPGGTTRIALSDVPRLGPKLFVLSGYDALGQRIVGGCEQIGDIDDDLELAIPAEPAVAARVIPGPGQVPSLILPRLAGDPAPATLAIATRTVRRPHPAPAGHAVRIYLRSAAGERLLGEALGDAEGVIEFQLPSELTEVRTGPTTSAPVVGPTELVIRAPWAERAERVPAFVPVKPLGVVGLGTPTELNQAAPSWAFVSGGSTANDFRAAAIRQLGAARAIVVATEVGDAVVAAGTISSAVVDKARALVGFDGAERDIVTRLDDGWYTIGASGSALVLDVPFSTTTADELHAVPVCQGPGVHAGLLVRSGAGPWEAYAGLEATQATGPLATLAAQLTAFTDARPGAVLENLLCITIGGAVATVAVMAAPGPARLERYAVAAGAPAMPLPFVGAITAMKADGGDLRPVGPIETGTGIRVVSYKVIVPVSMQPQLIPDGAIDYPLPGVPSDLLVDDANGDLLPDVLALTIYQGRLALSVTLGAAVAGTELTSLVPSDGDPGSAQLRRALLRENRDLQLITAGKSGLAAYDMATPATAQLEPP
ncbi:MAG: hypothetical protein IPL61_36940 [Myxococcales bacterium]|nr:hypothetical protein [Myxococcales bacterium]